MGYDVKVSEVHGMSQRGGSVTTYVRYSDERVYSPLIDEAGADIILAFEKLEACRAVKYLKIGGAIIVNTQQINPMPVITGAAVYPDNTLDLLAESGAAVYAADALSMAVSAGNAKTVNIALLGVLASHMDIEKEKWLETLKITIPARLLDINLKAFELGYGGSY
jgi:indolepyruvate ferredoxin oxidoreductase beta subunit